MLPEKKLTVKIHKFIITPIATAYNEAGEVVGEKDLKPIQHFAVTPLDLRSAALSLEKQYNSKLEPKVEVKSEIPKVEKLGPKAVPDKKSKAK